ncbi:hypothetical protein J3E73DRAFT_430530 [Bipolaris maydis]|nr:hypothetical protein J3E73DRAFT_430530 [Bipolaris maydis]
MRRGDRWQKLLLIARGPWRNMQHWAGQRGLEAQQQQQQHTHTHTRTDDAFGTQRPRPPWAEYGGRTRLGNGQVGLVCVSVLYAATATAWSPAIHPPRPSGSTLTRLTASSTVCQAGNVTQPSVYILLHSPLPVLKHRRPPFETRLATRLDWPSLPVAYRALPCRQTIGLHLKHCAFLPSCPQHHSQSCLPPKPAIQPLALACRRALPTRLAATASRRTTTPIGPVRLPLGLASHLHRQPRGPLLLSITLASPTTRSLTHTVPRPLRQ